MCCIMHPLCEGGEEEKMEDAERRPYAFCMADRRTEGNLKILAILGKGRRGQKDPVRGKFVVMFYALLMREAGQCLSL